MTLQWSKERRWLVKMVDDSGRFVDYYDITAFSHINIQIYSNKTPLPSHPQAKYQICLGSEVWCLGASWNREFAWGEVNFAWGLLEVSRFPNFPIFRFCRLRKQDCLGFAWGLLGVWWQPVLGVWGLLGVLIFFAWGWTFSRGLLGEVIFRVSFAWGRRFRHLFCLGIGLGWICLGLWGKGVSMLVSLQQGKKMAYFFLHCCNKFGHYIIHHRLLWRFIVSCVTIRFTFFCNR